MHCRAYLWKALLLLGAARIPLGGLLAPRGDPRHLLHVGIPPRGIHGGILWGRPGPRGEKAAPHHSPQHGSQVQLRGNRMFWQAPGNSQQGPSAGRCMAPQLIPGQPAAAFLNLSVNPSVNDSLAAHLRAACGSMSAMDEVVGLVTGLGSVADQSTLQSWGLQNVRESMPCAEGRKACQAPHSQRPSVYEAANCCRLASMVPTTK